MPKKHTWAALIAVAICVYASHAYAQRQAYRTGVYIGKASFAAADLQNRHCLGLRAGSERRCEVNDLSNDSVVERAMASANIMPSISESEVTAIHTGFRDGWREARTAAFASRDK